MLPIMDLQTDSADDIIISGDDFLVESNILQCSLNVAGRRICGRFDDNTFRENLCAGLERFLFSSNILNSTYDIKSAIIKCLSRDNLFFSSDFTVEVGKSTEPREAKLYIIFKTSILGSVSTFKIFIDVENQRVYRSN
jgi:hypothetical protein